MHTVEEELSTAINMKFLSFASFRSETNLNPMEDIVYYVHHLHSETVFYSQNVGLLMHFA